MQYLKKVSTLRLDQHICNGCTICTLVCPHAVFKMVNKKAQIIAIDNCMECGVCAKNCETGAITVQSGVGCATGILYGILNNTEPSCDCTTTNNSNYC